MIYNHTPILCNDILKLIDRGKFAQFTGQHKTDKRKKSFSTWQLFLGLFIGQITNADSLRDLCTILGVRKNNRYHLGLTSFSRSTFSDRLAKTDSSVFENMFYYMVHQVKNLSSHSLKRNDDDKVYAIDSSLISLTLNITDRPAIEIAALYKRRWEIETLFKRMKQNLKIKQFFGTSKNAVHSQIRVALIYYLLLVFIKLKTKCNESLLELTRKIAVLLFDKVNLLFLLGNSVKKMKEFADPPNQPTLFYSL